MYYIKKVRLIKEENQLRVYPLEQLTDNFFENYLKPILQNYDENVSSSEDGCDVAVIGYGSSGSYGVTLSPYFEYQILHDEGHPGADWSPIPHIHLVDLDVDVKMDFVRSYPFMDGSIWNYGIWCEKCYEKPGMYQNHVTERLKSCFNDIFNNWEKGYYKLGNSREYADLNARIARESKLNGGPHAEVSPFVFHSENKTLKSLVKSIEACGGKYCLGHKWRVLLVDDHSSKPLNDCSGYSVTGGPSKMDVITDRLKSFDKSLKIAYKKAESKEWEYESEDKDYDIAIECVETIEGFLHNVFGTLKASGNGYDISPKRYDIILLDYLLEDDFSYRIFAILKALTGYLNVLDSEQGTASVFGDVDPNTVRQDDDTIVINNGISIPRDRLVEWLEGGIGPAERLYFMFISSYTYAIQERLEEQGISRSEKYWHIGRGACPINTPSLFLFNLHAIMKKRIGTLLGDLPKAKEFFQDMYKESAGSLDVDHCRALFSDMLRLKSAYGSVIKDYSKDDKKGLDSFTSPLYESVFGQDELPEEFWESMRHLSYMICYYSSEHWPEMWEEFHVMKRTLSGAVLSDEIWTQILSVIRKHLLSLADRY